MLRGRGACKRAVHALRVVIISQLPLEVGSVPEKHAIQVLAPNRADQPFDERMRNRRIRNRLDLLDFEDAQIGKPTVKAKQQVVIRADMFRQ